MNATTVSLSTRRRLALGLSLLVIGVLLGALFGLLAEFILSLFDFQGILGVGAHVGEARGLALTAALGTLIAIVGTGTLIAEAMRAEISDDDVLLTWKGASVRVRKELVSSIYLGEDIVLYSKSGTELARARAINPQALRSSLIHHGYPTPSHTEQGEGEFTDDIEILDDDAKRIAAARTKALKTGNTDIAEILRRQLASMGVMSRDLKAGRMGLRTEFRKLEPFRSAAVTA